MVYVIPIFEQLASRIRMKLQFQLDFACKLFENLYDVYHCCAYSEILLMMDSGTVRSMYNFIPK
jgi:hypothetical protein